MAKHAAYKYLQNKPREKIATLKIEMDRWISMKITSSSIQQNQVISCARLTANLNDNLVKETAITSDLLVACESCISEKQLILQEKNKSKNPKNLQTKIKTIINASRFTKLRRISVVPDEEIIEIPHAISQDFIAEIPEEILEISPVENFIPEVIIEAEPVESCELFLKALNIKTEKQMQDRVSTSVRKLESEVLARGKLNLEKFRRLQLTSFDQFRPAPVKKQDYSLVGGNLITLFLGQSQLWGGRYQINKLLQCDRENFDLLESSITNQFKT